MKYLRVKQQLKQIDETFIIHFILFSHSFDLLKNNLPKPIYPGQEVKSKTFLSPEVYDSTTENFYVHQVLGSNILCVLFCPK